MRDQDGVASRRQLLAAGVTPGRIRHQPATGRWQLRARPAGGGAEPARPHGRRTLRYGWREIVADPCGVAEVAEVLRNLGWPGRVIRCGPDCRLGQ